MGWISLLLPLAFCSQIEQPPWVHEYGADQPLDQAVPRLHAEVTEAGLVAVRDGCLVIRAPELKGGAFVAVGKTARRDQVAEHEWGDVSAWDGSQPTTVEARMRVVELLDGARIAAMLQASNGWTTWNLEFGEDGLYNTGQRVFELDASAFHVYRFTFRDGEANALVDGERLPQSCIRELPHQRNALMVGDFSSAVAGVTEWDAIRWTNREATPFTMPERVSNIEIDSRFEVVTPRIPYPCSTAGGSVVLSDGRVLFTYSGPVNPHGKDPGTTRIYGRISEDAGGTWGEERELIHHPECQACGPSILRTSDGVLRLFYMGFYASVWKDGNPVFPDCRSDLWTAISRDDGETWEGRQCIWQGYTGATNGALQAESGAMLVPFSYDVLDPGRLVSACVVSEDGGKTWTLGESIDMGGAGDHAGAIEPAVVQLRDGRILMMIRTQKGFLYQAFSDDDGMTWSAPQPTVLGSPNAPCYITRLADGRLAIVWNNTMATTKGRDTIWIACSGDEAESWTEPLRIGKAEQLSYPFLLEVRPGRLMITCNHVRSGWQRVSPVVLLADESALLPR